MKRRLLDMWIQKTGTAYEHFDIAKTKRDLAIMFGAVPVTMRELAGKIRNRRGAA